MTVFVLVLAQRQGGRSVRRLHAEVARDFHVDTLTGAIMGDAPAKAWINFTRVPGLLTFSATPV